MIRFCLKTTVRVDSVKGFAKKFRTEGASQSIVSNRTTGEANKPCQQASSPEVHAHNNGLRIRALIEPAIGSS